MSTVKEHNEYLRRKVAKQKEEIEALRLLTTPLRMCDCPHCIGWRETHKDYWERWQAFGKEQA